MIYIPAKAKKQERGAALLMALFALLLLSAIGGFMLLSARTETRIDGNYSSSLNAYYGANAGLTEVRDRVKYSSAIPGGLADLLPTDIAGNPNGVLYILNPSAGEALDPADPASKYFDSQLCHDYNSGAGPGDRCTTVPGVAGWKLHPQNSIAPPSGPLGYKWVRINIKTNRTVLPNYCVDQPCASAALDTPVCWDGQVQQLTPGGVNPSCDANGMQTVYTLTSLGATAGLNENAARKFVRTEVVAPSIRPPGAITMDAASATATLGDGSTIPSTLVDGRPHRLDRTLASGNVCSAVAALATDNASSTSQLTQGLNNVRQAIVQTANASCNADGSSIGSNYCSPALWWVRGTNSTPQFVVNVTTSNSGTGSSHDGHDGEHSSTTTTSPCDPTSASCYTNLNLSAPQLVSLPSPFAGGPGNQTPGSIYQAPQAATVPDEITALLALVNASTGQPNYTQVASTALSSNYGAPGNPAIVRVLGTSLNLQTSLTGYGVLIVPNDLEINAGGILQWTGIVLVQSGTAQFKVGSGGSGFINGALMLQPTAGSAVSLVTTASGAGNFTIFYSCDAIDMVFGSLPYKLLSSSELSF